MPDQEPINQPSAPGVGVAVQSGGYRMRVSIGRLDCGLLPASAFLLICAIFFIWASGRGYDFKDEAYYLAWESTPFSYHFSLSLFGFFWHPIYTLVGGDVALLRIVGAGILLACSAVFAFALNKFIELPTAPRSERYLVVLSVCTSAFWFFATWLTVPGYDELNLCAMLILVSSLLMAAAPKYAHGDHLRHTIWPAILAGASLGVIALVKPTTSAIAVVMAFAWLALLRPARPLVLVGVSAASAITALAVFVLLIDGSFSTFVHRELSNFTMSRLMDQPGDIHGIGNSIVGPFAKDRVWKIFPAIAIGAAIFAVCLAITSSSLGLTRIGRGLRRAVPYGLATLLAVFIALARAVDPQPVIAWYNYHAWYMTLLILAVAMAVVLLRRKDTVAEGWQRNAYAAAFIALVPAAYSLGTNESLLRHMEGAAIFWAGSTILVCALGSPESRTKAVAISSFVIGITTIGLLAGVARAPLAWEAPLLQQTEPVIVGPSRTRLLTDKATAGYIGSIQRAAAGAGFKPGTLVIDLAESGPGIVFALSGATAGSPWLADAPNGSLAIAFATLSRVPKSELQHAWVLTGSDQNLAKVRATLQRLGLAFPSDYHTVIAARLDSFGWQHRLWKPAR